MDKKLQVTRKTTEKYSKKHNKKRNKKVIFLSLLVIIVISIAATAYFLYPSSNDLPKIYRKIVFQPEDHQISHGSIYSTPEGLIVMDLNGSYEEMGYAHGVLMGEYIRYMIEYLINSDLINGDLEKYDELHNIVIPTYLEHNSSMHDGEFNAIVQGAMEAGVNMYVNSLRRTWDVNDLYLVNAIQDWYQSFCSAVGVWDDFSANNSPILGRNMDFGIDANGYLSQLYMLHIYRGENGRNDIISFSFPGMISVYSGFNSKGVWISTDSSNGPPTYRYNRTMITMSMRNFLEQEDGVNITQDAVSFFLGENPTQSFLLFIGSNESDSDPIFILEGNDDQVIFRTGSEENDNSVILTNHERILQSPVECGRYVRYLENLNEFGNTGDNKVDNSEIKKMLQESGGCYSINCIIFQPATLEFQVGFTRINCANNSKWDDNLVIGGPWDPLLDTVYSFYDFRIIFFDF